MSGNGRTPDPLRTALRTAVAAVERALTRLPASPAEPTGAPGDLATAWHELVELLALGPEPEYRECPACGATVMRDATVCGHCWAKLAPRFVTTMPTARSSDGAG